jgi:hypothetical protein
MIEDFMKYVMESKIVAVEFWDDVDLRRVDPSTVVSANGLLIK